MNNDNNRFKDYDSDSDSSSSSSSSNNSNMSRTNILDDLLPTYQENKICNMCRQVQPLLRIKIHAMISIWKILV
jgi:hypothetical protein